MWYEQKSGTRGAAECVTDVTEQTHGNMELFVKYIIQLSPEGEVNSGGYIPIPLYTPNNMMEVIKVRK